MSYFKRSFSYSKMEDEDPDEVKHRRAQWLIARVLEQADYDRRRLPLRLRICRFKIKIGKRFTRIRKTVQCTISIARVGVSRHVMSQLKLWRCALRRRGAMISLPPLFG